MKEIFVSLSGSDNGEGTIKKPFKTLEKAAQFAKNMPGNEEVFINIRGGRYFFKESFVLNKDNSGEKDKRVTYRAYNNEKVYFDGGIILDSSKAVPITDERVKDRIIDKNAIKELLEIDLSEYDIIYGKYGTRGFRRPYVPEAVRLKKNLICAPQHFVTRMGDAIFGKMQKGFMFRDYFFGVLRTILWK